MGFTAGGMLQRYKTKLYSLEKQTSNQLTAMNMADQCLLWLFEAITEEIHENARATGTDTRGDSHELRVE